MIDPIKDVDSTPGKKTSIIEDDWAITTLARVATTSIGFFIIAI